jgi:hypothetical protein
LKDPPQGWVFEKLQISGGKYLTMGFTFARGKRVPHLTLERGKNDLIARLEWLAKKHVILHDTHDRRAWLVDGPSALLYLVRESLVADSKGCLKHLYRSVHADLSEPDNKYAGRAASMAILTNERNLDKELRNKIGSTDQTGSQSEKYCLKDRVVELLGIMEQIIDHQEDVKSDEGIGFRVARSPWRNLEGFDFRDIAGRSDPFNAKGTELERDAKGWVVFTRAIHAITLFGEGFGNLLCPNIETASTCSQCHWNNPPPTGRDILAVSMADLEYLHSDESEWEQAGSDERLVVRKFVWEKPSSCFIPCTCGTLRNSPTRIQTFRERSERPMLARPRKHIEAEAGEVSSLGGVLLGIDHKRLRKSNLTATTDARQHPSSTAVDDLDPDQRRSNDDDGHASASTTGPQQFTPPSSTQASSSLQKAQHGVNMQQREKKLSLRERIKKRIRL